jgi:hypothetical protein
LDSYYSDVFYINLKGTIPQIRVADTLFCEGSSVTVHGSPSGLGTGSYRWYLDSILIEGQNNSAIDVDQEGTYQVKALTNDEECPGLFYPSNSITLHYIKPVVYATYKPDLNRVTLSTAIDYQSYQWYQVSSTTSADLLIEGATQFKYNAAIDTEAKYYAVSITTNSGCTAMSDLVMVNDSVYSIPEIITDINGLYCRNESLVLELKNQAYVSYQWMKNGNDIWGATLPDLNVTDDYTTGSGIYSVKVRYPNDTITELTSGESEISFSPQPFITIKDDAKPCPGGKVVLNTRQGWNGADGGYESYKWYFNDENNLDEAVLLSQATGSVIEINVPASTRYYWVITSYGNCSDTSNTRNISPFELSEPYISMDPWDGLICMGDTLTLNIYTEDVNCKWFMDGIEIAGEQATTLKTTKGGKYAVEISSTVCETTSPVLSAMPAQVNYRVSPEFTISPEGEIYNNNPDHRIFCKGEAITLSLDHADRYTNYQWIG